MMTVNVCGELFSCDFTANRHSLNKDERFALPFDDGSVREREGDLKQLYYPSEFPTE